MATSNSHDYTETANGVITEALSLIGVYDPGETLSSNDTTSALVTLNMMIKAWQSQGLGMWLKKEYSLFLQGDTISYSIGLGGTHCTLSAVKTEISTAVSSGDSSVVVDSYTGIGNTFDRDGIALSQKPTGATALTLAGATVSSGVAYLPQGTSYARSARKITIYGASDESAKTFAVVGTDANGAALTETITGPNATTVYSTYEFLTVTSVTPSGGTTGNIEVGVVGDHIGIELDDGTIQWTNISAAVNSTTLSLITTTTDDSAVDNHVYTYTAKAQRPLEIDEVRLVSSDATERPLLIVSRNEYMALSDKTSEGSPNQIYFDPQTQNAVIRVWLEPNNMKEFIKFTGKYPIQDADALTNNLDFPQEWLEMLSWNLAVRLSPKYGKAIDPNMVTIANHFKEQAFNFDREYTSIFIQVV